jgi:phage tail-like protein
MSADKQQRYRFATPAQWNMCLFSQADADFLGAGSGVRPLPPFATTPTRFAAKRAFAPAVTCADEIVFADHDRSLVRLAPGGDQLMADVAPAALANAERIVATSNALWAASESGAALYAYDVESLTRVAEVDLAPHRVIDIARDGQDGLYALVHGDHGVRAVHVSRSGRITGTILFDGIADAKAFVYLSQPDRFVVLTSDRQRLYWFADTGGRSLLGRAAGAMHPCFTADLLGSDSRNRVLVGGTDGARDGGRSFVLILDGDGLSIDELEIDPSDAPITGLVAARDTVLVTGQRGLLRFAATQVVPDGASALQCMMLTPALSAADRADGRRWLRVDAAAQLAAGAAIEITFASTDDADVVARLATIAADASRPASARIDAIRSEPDVWSDATVFQGSADTAIAAGIYSAKLFDVQEQYVWVSVKLVASSGATLPVLQRLDVLYPGLTLMQKLPAIYQRDEARPDSFLRNFVGVVEATTQDIDARVGSLGSKINPATAPVEWLDFVARWLGVPWDDGLSDTQKRTIVTRAPDLLKTRGTRAGIELFLACLLPQVPRRFRVTDATADFGFAILGGGGSAGSELPALLGGATMWTTALDSTSRLGCMRLPCDGQTTDAALPFAGSVQVDVAASATERMAWKPWLRALVEQMMPLTARLQFRWVGLDTLRSDRLDGSFVLESMPDPTVGTDTVTNVARLPQRGTRLSASGSSLSTRLL